MQCADVVSVDGEAPSHGEQSNVHMQHIGMVFRSYAISHGASSVLNGQTHVYKWYTHGDVVYLYESGEISSG